MFPENKLVPTTIRLYAYPGEAIEGLGSVNVNVTFRKQSAYVSLLVVAKTQGTKPVGM